MSEIKAFQLALVAIFGVIVPERVIQKMVAKKKEEAPAGEIKKRLMAGEL